MTRDGVLADVFEDAEVVGFQVTRYAPENWTATVIRNGHQRMSWSEARKAGHVVTGNAGTMEAAIAGARRRRPKPRAPLPPSSDCDDDLADLA